MVSGINEIDEIFVKQFLDHIGKDTANEDIRYFKNVNNLVGTKVLTIFFSRSLRAKVEPEYPMLLIESISTNYSSELPNQVDNNLSLLNNNTEVRVRPAPDWFELRYQVSAFSRNWKQSRQLQKILTDKVFPTVYGSKFIDIASFNRAVVIEDVSGDYRKDEGIFQTNVTYMFTVPLFANEISEEAIEPSVETITVAVDIGV